MKARGIYSSFIILALIGLPLSHAVAGEDAEGCRDHAMFTRMSSFHIAECETKEFDAYAFVIGGNAGQGEPKTKTVEGKVFRIHYQLNEDRPQSSDRQIIRNYSNAVKKMGGKVVSEVIEAGSSYNYMTASFSKNGKNIWVSIPSASETEYELVLVEQQGMQQEVTASDMMKALDEKGFIALHINFDTGKAVIKPDSAPIIGQLYTLLNENPGLKVSIEGHTDNVGKSPENRKLSESRARAVRDALISKGIDKGRLSYSGFGQDRPVADNGTEEGRAKNRRVEIVKR